MIKARGSEDTNANGIDDDEEDEEMGGGTQSEELKKVKVLKIIKEKNRVSGN